MSSPSRKIRCQISRFTRSHRRSAWRPPPERCSSARRRSSDGTNIPRRSARGPRTNSSTTGQKRPRNQGSSGTGNPILGRVRIDGGTRSRTASRSTAFVRQPASLNRPGVAAAYSTTVRSRNGTRLSIEADILIWSCFISSSTRYVWRSAWLMRSRKPPGASSKCARAVAWGSRARSAASARRSRCHAAGKTAKASKKRARGVAGRARNVASVYRRTRAGIARASPAIQRGDPVAVVTEEQLVGALAGQHDLDVVAGEARHEREGDAGRGGDGLVLVPDEPRQGLEELIGRERHLAVLGADPVGDEPRPGELVGARLVEADRERAYGLAHHSRHQHRQRTRVDAAGEEQPERDIRHQVAANGGGQVLAQTRGTLREAGGRLVERGRQLPVAARPDPLPGRPRQRPPGEQRFDVAEERLRSGHRARGEELGNDRGVERRPAREGGQNRLDLRREQELVPRERVVQRLDAEPIAREEQPPPGPIPEREGEHAIQALDAALAIVFVRVHDRLGVAARPVAVAPRLEARAQRGVVVDLAVVDDPDGLVLVGHGLVTARHVDDRQPAMAESDRPVEQQALAVRPAMAEHVAHPFETRFVLGLPGVALDDSRDAAHGSARALANAGRRHGPPRPMSHARQVLGDEKGEVHLGASQHSAARRVPLLGTLAQNRLAGHAAQRAKESSVELVVMRRTQISVRAVPAPAPTVIPEIERADQSGDSVREQLIHPPLSRLRGEIPEAEQAEKEAVEHAGQRVAGVLLVQRVAVLKRPDAAVLDVLLEDARGGVAQLEQMLAAAQPVSPDEHADAQALGHRADPRGLELAAPLAPVERVGPDENAVKPSRSALRSQRSRLARPYQAT